MDKVDIDKIAEHIKNSIREDEKVQDPESAENTPVKPLPGKDLFSMVMDDKEMEQMDQK